MAEGTIKDPPPVYPMGPVALQRIIKADAQVRKAVADTVVRVAKADILNRVAKADTTSRKA